MALILEVQQRPVVMVAAERIAWCITERLAFLGDLFQKAMDAGEISDVISAPVLANNVTGMAMSHILERRISYHKKSFKEEYMDNIQKWMQLLQIKK